MNKDEQEFQAKLRAMALSRMRNPNCFHVFKLSQAAEPAYNLFAVYRCTLCFTLIGVG